MQIPSEELGFAAVIAGDRHWQEQDYHHPNFMGQGSLLWGGMDKNDYSDLKSGEDLGLGTLLTWVTNQLTRSLGLAWIPQEVGVLMFLRPPL